MIDEKFKNKTITNLLRNVAASYLLKGDASSRFKIIAYEKAADTVEHLTRELKDIWQEGKISEVSGFGKSIASNMDEYFSTGRSKHFESVMEGIPPSVFTLMLVPSIGPKRAFKLAQAFKFYDAETILEDIKKAAETDKIAELEGFGKKSQEDILAAIKRYEMNEHKEERMPLPYAHAIAEEIIAYLRQLPEIRRADALGSMRRRVATIGDVDIAVEADDNVSEKILDHFVKFPGAIHIDNRGDKKASIILASHIRVDLRVQTGSTYGSMLQYFTGSKAHNIKLREYALKKGYSLNEYGIKQVKEAQSRQGGIKLKTYEFDNEKDFYNFLGLEYVPPEIREGTNEIDFALKNKVPHLVELVDIKGDLHTHSSYDLKPSHDAGKHSYQEMLSYAEQKGYEYIGFADHNPKTSGQTEQEIIDIMKKRKEEIEIKVQSASWRTKAGQRCKAFIGLEVDILPTGKLALPEKAIEYVDYLIVSVHSVFNLGVNEMTERVLRALSYPKVKILGHPTGRLLTKREGFELNWEKIFMHAKENNIALEINAHPSRLDLPDTLVREGLKYGVKYMIDTDAHAADNMDLMQYGVSVARRGWCTKNDIVNTLGYNEFREWIEK